MNNEQNTPENSSGTGGATSNQSTEKDTAVPQPASDTESPQVQDEYYAVDYGKKEVVTTIGDGEMHDEGLAGVEDVTGISQSSQERLSDEQDEAEFHDSEQ